MAETLNQGGDKFRQIREEWLSMTQTELAEALGTSRSHISRTERGLSEYTYSQIRTLEAMCGPVAFTLLLDIPEPPKTPWLKKYTALSKQNRHKLDQIIHNMLEMIEK